MGSIVAALHKKNLIHPPSHLPGSVFLETMMGSIAYGCSGGNSDIDVYGFSIPPKNVIFPHLAGEIEGFGRQKKRFEQWQEHHITDPDTGKEYDFQIYNIVKYFQLCMENNPNMIDSLFTPEFCVLHSTRISTMVREKRKLFLHKGHWPKFKGYAYSQMHKALIKSPETGSKRMEVVEKFGFDVKFMYHVVRLMYEAEQILTTGDLDLQRDREHLKAIRAGEQTLEQIREWASAKGKVLEETYISSTLPWGPPEKEIKELLLTCLEEHYGSLDKCVIREDEATRALREINEIIQKHGKLL